MPLITRTYSFTDGQTAYGSQVDAEIANIVNTLNSVDQGNTTITTLRVTTLLPLADVDMSGNTITNLGAPSTSGDAAVYPITNTQITAGTIRGSSANSGGVEQEIDQGTISTPDFRAEAVTKSSATGEAGYGALGGGDVTQASRTITTIGGKVLIFGSIGLQSANSNAATAIWVSRGDTAITGNNITKNNPGGSVPLGGTICCLDSPAAGTYTYNLKYNNGGHATTINTASIVVVELRA